MNCESIALSTRPRHHSSSWGFRTVVPARTVCMSVVPCIQLSIAPLMIYHQTPKLHNNKQH